MGDAQERKDRLITPEEAADRLAVSPLTIKKWLRQGKLEGKKLFGGDWRVREDVIDNYIKNNEEELS